MSNYSFFEGVEKNFNKAAPFTGLPKGLLEQIKGCNAVYRVKFPVKVGEVVANMLLLMIREGVIVTTMIR